MSKKSIRSKGYRKSAKKPYLSKRDILIVVGVIAVIVIGIVLFNLLYDDGSLDVVDGVAQVQGENSLLINAGSANNPRYFKLGQLADIEGYALESAPAGVDENVREFTYVPEGDSPYDEITRERQRQCGGHPLRRHARGLFQRGKHGLLRTDVDGSRRARGAVLHLSARVRR